MTHDKSPLLSGVLAIAGLMTAIVANPSMADEPSQPIGPTTKSVISLPFGLEWTHNPFEAVEVLRKIPGVSEIWFGTCNLMEMSEAEVRDQLTSRFSAHSYEHWGRISNESIRLVVQPILIQQVACSMELEWATHKGLIAADPDHVTRVTRVTKTNKPEVILWPVYLKSVSIESKDIEALTPDGVGALRRLFVPRYREISQRVHERIIAHILALPDNQSSTNQIASVVNSKVFQAFQRAHLALSFCDSCNQQETAQRDMDRLWEMVGDQKSSSLICFKLCDHLTSLTSGSTTWNTDGSVKYFSLSCDDLLAKFECGLSSSLRIKYSRGDRYPCNVLHFGGYSEMLAEAERTYEAKAKERAQVELRRSRQNAPELTNEL